VSRVDQTPGPGLSIISSHVLRTLDLLRATFSEAQARARLSPRPDQPRAPALRGPRQVDRGSIATLWAQIRHMGPATAADERLLADPDTLDAAES
jgi:hydroxymethylglutaryl-CoA reductase (NADPH)